MNILVLGGTGAIGAHLCPMLGSLGHRVVCTTRGMRPNSHNVEYVKGNARNNDFLRALLADKWSCIADFMIYDTQEFAARSDLLLARTDQYLFISSGRVYADSSVLIHESSPRFVDVTTDITFLQSDEYAIAKARQEDILTAHAAHNWTIARPYITYDSHRLQLGILEKEEWLFRALQGAPILFPKELLPVKTTMTAGLDVAKTLCRLIGADETLGKAFNVTATHSLCWQTVLDCYLTSVCKITTHRPRVHLCDVTTFDMVYRRRYQLQQDRLLNRCFDNTAIKQLVDTDSFEHPNIGLHNSLETFLRSPSFGHINWGAEGRADRAAGHWRFNNKPRTSREHLQYLKHRLTPLRQPPSYPK